MIHKGIIAVFVLIFLQLGCASHGFNRGELKNQLGVTKPSFDDNAIKEAYNKKPNLPKPFKLAVYFKSPAQNTVAASWRWTSEDKIIFDEIVKNLKNEKIVAEVFPLVPAIVQDEELRSLRLVAAKHQADALLIISGAGEIDRYINNWGWSYALVLPTFFIKGSQADTLFVASASLWDVKNEYLYLSAEAEATTSDRYAAAFGKNDKDLMSEAKSKSLLALGSELKKMIQGIKL